MSRRRALLSLVAVVSLISPPLTVVAAASPAGVPAAEEGDVLTVMSRNLYLGADVGVALELLPDMPSAAQFMWEQVAASDFAARGIAAG